MSILNDNIRVALGKYIQAVADGAEKQDPALLVTARALFDDIGGNATKIEAYVQTAYEATDETKADEVAPLVEKSIVLMKKLGALP